MPNTPETNVPPITNAYPDNKPNPEVEQLKAQIADMQTKMGGLEKENGELKQKLADIEHKKLVALAEKVADIKVGKGLLKEDEKGTAVKELTNYDVKTLELLEKELSSISVKLSQTPKPLATPAPDPAPQLSEKQKFDADVKLTRMQLFGHEDDPFTYYQDLKKRGEL